MFKKLCLGNGDTNLSRCLRSGTRDVDGLLKAPNPTSVLWYLPSCKLHYEKLATHNSVKRMVCYIRHRQVLSTVIERDGTPSPHGAGQLRACLA